MTTALWPSPRSLTGETSVTPASQPLVEPAAVRRAMGRIPTSVAVVTASLDGEPIGMTIGSLTSVSLDPPLVAFFAFAGSSTFAQLRQCDQFCINVLSEDQAEICHGFARKDGVKFELGNWELHAGVPRITNAVATVLCERESVFAAGDHLGMVGRVTDVEFSDHRPLLYYRGQTSQLLEQPAA